MPVILIKVLVHLVLQWCFSWPTCTTAAPLISLVTPVLCQGVCTKTEQDGGTQNMQKEQSRSSSKCGLIKETKSLLAGQAGQNYSPKKEQNRGTKVQEWERDKDRK